MVGAGTAASLGLVSCRGLVGTGSGVLAGMGSLVGDRTSGGRGTCSDSPSRGAFGDSGAAAASPSPDAGVLEGVAMSEGLTGA